VSGGGARRHLPLLLLLFAGSGCSALIYEIVWYQLLQLVIGSSAVSLGVLLATFMGGLCMGSLLLPRLKLAGEHPLRVYGKLELGIAACGILVLFLMPLVDSVYTSAVGHGMPAILLRALVSGLCLLPPTFLMGASLPAASRWVAVADAAAPEGVGILGMLYGANTVGAVVGCLLAGFYLLRVFDLATATFVAAAINAAVGLASFSLAKRAPQHTAAVDTKVDSKVDGKVNATPAMAAGAWPVYLTIALSGATALGAEVIWTRLLSLMLGATVYTFSIILSVFLVGIGIGSTGGATLARGARNPKALLGWSQMLLAAAVAWTAYMLSQSLPYWPINPLLSTSPWYTFQIDMVRCLWALLPAALLWGASFPLALAAAASRQGDPGRLVGGIYAANTGGAIVGALCSSMILIPWIGTGRSQAVLIATLAGSGLLMLVPLLRPFRLFHAVNAPNTLAMGAAAVVALLLAENVSPVPGMLIAYGRRMMTSMGRSEVLFTGEGINSSIAITKWDDGAIQFHVSGKVEASTESYDMRLQRMLGHLPALVHSRPESVLIVGFGAGVTAGSFVVHPEVKRIVICEMEPLIPPTATKYFGPQNYFVVNDPRTQMIYDDARHFVLTTPEKFDIVTSDPIHPWVKGSATLYSKEYFELVKQHLNPGGVITQWVPLYESDPETVKSEIATFFDAFPNGTIWGNDISGGGYDLVLMGQVDPARIDMDKMQARLESPEGARVAASLREVGFSSAVQLLATYTGQEPDLRPWLAGAEINRDGNLRLQYMAGLALNVSKEGAIYNQMLTYRKFPDNLFAGSEERKRALRYALNPASAGQ
jgi:spermidine synthase